MNRAEKYRDSDTGQHHIWWWCPGCESYHRAPIDKPELGGATWTWNGSLEKPTLSPSYVTGQDGFKRLRCHCFIEEGRVRFLADCYHALKGQTVDLPEADSKFGGGTVVVGDPEQRPVSSLQKEADSFFEDAEDEAVSYEDWDPDADDDTEETLRRR